MKSQDIQNLVTDFQLEKRKSFFAIHLLPLIFRCLKMTEVKLIDQQIRNLCNCRLPFFHIIVADRTAVAQR
ncbi:unnamed protein product [Schistosoma guineensis]|nr:unnamed protein product [Schistosoma guineensis]